MYAERGSSWPGSKQAIRPCRSSAISGSCGSRGFDTETGRRKPRQLGTFKSRRSAQSAANSFVATGELASDRDTVAHLVERWVAGKVDVSNKTRSQYEWAAGHICTGIGGVRVDRLDRDDVARWLEGLAADGRLSRRSIQIMRMVLRASLAEAVDLGELRRSPASRVGMPRNVAKTSRERQATAWTAGVAGQLRSDVGAVSRARRRHEADVTWAAAHRRDAHGSARIRSGRDPCGCRHPRPQALTCSCAPTRMQCRNRSAPSRTRSSKE